MNANQSLANNTSQNTKKMSDFEHRKKLEHHIIKQKQINFLMSIGLNDVTLLENGSLRIHNISRKNSGLYVCYGYNVMGYSSAEIR